MIPALRRDCKHVKKTIIHYKRFVHKMDENILVDALQSHQYCGKITSSLSTDSF